MAKLSRGRGGRKKPKRSDYYVCPNCNAVLTVPAPPLREVIKPKNPRTRAGISRAVKTVIFYILGFVLAVAAFAVVGILSGTTVIPDWVVQITGLAIAGIAAGIYKAVNWKDSGIDPALLPTPTASPSLPTLEAPLSLTETPKQEEEKV